MDIHGCPWISMDPWISMELHGYPWDVQGYKWISMDIHGYPWKIHGFPRISVEIHGMDIPNPFRHQMARRLSWEDVNQTNLDDSFVRVFENIEVVRFLLSIFMYWSVCLILILGGTVDHQISCWVQMGPPRTILGAFYAQVTFRETTQSWKSISPMFPVMVFDETRRNRCAIALWLFPSPCCIKDCTFHAKTNRIS